MTPRRLRIARLAAAASALLAVTIGAVVPPSGGASARPGRRRHTERARPARPATSRTRRCQAVAKTPASSTARSTSTAGRCSTCPDRSRCSQTAPGHHRQRQRVRHARGDAVRPADHHRPFAERRSPVRPSDARSFIRDRCRGIERDVYRTPYDVQQQLDHGALAHRAVRRDRRLQRPDSAVRRAPGRHRDAGTRSDAVPSRLLLGGRRPRLRHLRQRQRRRGLGLALRSAGVRPDRHVRRRRRMGRVRQLGERRVDAHGDDPSAAFPSVSGDGRFVSFAASKALVGRESRASARGSTSRTARTARSAASATAQRRTAYHTSITTRRFTGRLHRGSPTACKYDTTTLSGRVLRLSRHPRSTSPSVPRPASRAPFSTETISLAPNGCAGTRDCTSSRRCRGTDAGWRGSPTPPPGSASTTRRSSGHNAFMRRRDPGLVVDPIDFGTIAANTTSTLATTVRNTGRTSVSLDSITATPGQFTIQGGGTCVGGSFLPPGATCTVNVRYAAPNNTSTTNGSITVAESGYDPISAAGGLIGRSSFTPPPDTTTTAAVRDDDDRRSARCRPVAPRRRPARPHRRVTCRSPPIPIRSTSGRSRSASARRSRP